MRLGLTFTLALTCAAMACTSSSSTTSGFSVGGTVSGLSGTLVITDNGNDQLSISTDGLFTFGSLVRSGSAYSVAVVTQPAGQTCVVRNGAGTVSGANVGSIQIVCSAGGSALYSVGGTVSGLPGDGTLLLDNGTDQLTITASGPFTFAKQVPTGTYYNVTVDTNPMGSSCTVSGGTGTVQGASINSVQVTCSSAPLYVVGGSISGATGPLALDAGFGNPLTVTPSNPTSASFAFENVDPGTTYDISVSTPPAGQACTVSNGSGTVSNADITNVLITCINLTYAVTGRVTGNAGPLIVTLNGNTQTAQTVNASSSFSFTNNPNGLSYNIGVMSPPAGQTCTVSNPSGIIRGSDVINVGISCSPYVISGSFSADGNGIILSLVDNSNTTYYQYDSNTTGFFFTGFHSGDTYNLQVLASPAGQTCSISGNHAGTISGNVLGLSITCAPQVYTVAGTIRIPSGTADISDGITTLSGQTSGAWQFTSLPNGTNINVTATPSDPGYTCIAGPGDPNFTINSTSIVGIVIECG